MTNNEKLLAELNEFRVAAGMKPVADFRPARHMAQLEDFRRLTAEAEAQRKAQEEEADALMSAATEDAGDADDVTTEEAPAKEKLPAYKDFANYDRSSVVKPVEFVHTFLDAHPDLSRKAAVQALVEKGVNYSTARTQYQRWFSKRKG